MSQGENSSEQYEQTSLQNYKVIIVINKLITTYKVQPFQPKKESWLSSFLKVGAEFTWNVKEHMIYSNMGKLITDVRLDPSGDGPH